MAPDVLSGALLDFGRSSWLADEVTRDNPGLAASGFQPVGRYGIGFFASFMLGKRVKVRSRPQSGGPADTHVLEFGEGVEHRPILRRADPAERLNDAGTCVEVLLDSRFIKDDGPYLGGLVVKYSARRELALVTMRGLAEFVIPAADVPIWVSELGDDSETIAMAANDWTVIDGLALLSRVGFVSDPQQDNRESEALVEMSSALEVLYAPDGRPIGRVALVVRSLVDRFGWSGSWYSMVTAGPARCQTSVGGIAGILIGQPTTVSRESAVPIISTTEIAQWSTQAAARIVDGEGNEGGEWLRNFAEAVDELGGETSNMRRWHTGKGWLDYNELMKWIGDHDSICLIHPLYEEIRAGSSTTPIKMSENVISFEMGRRMALGREGDWPFESEQEFLLGGSLGKFVMAIAEGWSLEPEVVVAAMNRREREDVVIGGHNDEEIRGPAVVLLRDDVLKVGSAEVAD
jgi:hypothetical protein